MELILKKSYIWQKQIGYVPQEVYLLDDTIKSNVAFGVKEKILMLNCFKTHLN